MPCQATVLETCAIGAPAQSRPLQREAHELASILGAIIRNTRNNAGLPTVGRTERFTSSSAGDAWPELQRIPKFRIVQFVNFCAALLEQIIKRLLGTGRSRRRAGLAFDRRAGRKQRARVLHVLRGDTCGQLRVGALEACAGVERHAVDAAPHIHSAARAAGDDGVEAFGDGELVAATRALEDFVRRHQVRRLRPSGVLEQSSRRARLRQPASRASARAAPSARPDSRAGGTCDRTWRRIPETAAATK